MRYVIGLTGQIASGKSTVSQWLQQKGATVLDCDVIAHQVLTPKGGAFEGVKTHFGPKYLTALGEVDRKKLGEHVFKNPVALKKLEELTHPHILAMLQKQLAESVGMVILDAPLLFEADLHVLCDEVWIVTAPPKLRLQRICERDGLSVLQAQGRINSRREIAPKGDIHVRHIQNDSTLVVLHSKIARYWDDAEALWQKRQ